MSAGASRYVGVRLSRIDLDRGGREVLRDIRWTIRPGERWVLAGSNGAGKTQLLKLVSGAVWPTPTGRESRIYQWAGRRWPTPAEVQSEIVYLGPERQDKYERYGWNHTVLQIVGTGLHRTDIPLDALDASDLSRIAAVLERLSIAELAARQFLSLSYGQRRLALLARSLAARPKLLLLDELANGLDRTNHARALRWLESTSRTRLPWVLATHRIEDVPASATHALLLESGRIVQRGRLDRASLARWLGRKLRGAARKRAIVPRGRETRRRRGPAINAPGRLLVGLRHASIYLDSHPAIRNLTLELRAGECWVVHGPNGSGKTTLLRTLYGDHGVAAGGSIERTGIKPGVPLEVFKRRVGLVAPHLQTDHPLHLRVAEVVQSGRHASVGLNGPPTPADKAAARRALAFFGLSTLASRTLRELSYGQMRRVLFARAWINRPRLLLLDEPFAGIDGATRHALLALLDEVVRQGAGVLLATHHEQEWPAAATHELELADGRARYVGPVRSPTRVVALPVGEAPRLRRSLKARQAGASRESAARR